MSNVRYDKKANTVYNDFIRHLEDRKHTSRYFVGRKKSSVAIVTLVRAHSHDPYGAGDIIVNSHGNLIPGLEYFGGQSQMRAFFRARLALTLCGTGTKCPAYNVLATVRGGGRSGQADAIQVALAKGLSILHPAWKPRLRSGGLITSDARPKERKKYGLKKARKAPQFSKR